MNRYFSIFSLLFLALNVDAQVVINEIMQSNVDCVMDDINEFPDSWVELYNASEQSVNLSDYKIGTTKNAAEAWQLPSKTLASKAYVLIYCDKEGKGLHTNFRLDSGKGGAVYLMKSDGSVVDNITNIAKQPAPNIAYGRETDGSDAWGYQITATPGSKNNGKISSTLLGEPIFSTPGRVFEHSCNVKLTLSCPEGTPDDALIRYTTDGTEPTKRSNKYSAPITITSSMVIRAKIFCDGCLSRPSTTHSYIVHPRNVTLPVVSLVTNNKYLDDSQIGILVTGNDGSNPNYKNDWRRPFNFEYFESADGDSELNQLCEGRVSGGASRGASLKSLALYANKRFGEKRFKYEFFPEDKPGLNNFKSILLRNAGNDFDYLYMRDVICQRAMARHADIDYQGYRPAIVYINGTYKGMLNIRERSNEDNVFSNYDELEDIDLFENWNQLKEGTEDNLNAFKAFFNEHGHTWDEYNELMDLDEFINYNIMNFFFNNIDFPGNNLIIWRPRAEGGRWRFIAKDVDYVMNLYNSEHYDYPYLTWFYWNEYDSDHSWANTYEATRLFRRLMEDETFSRRFIDRFAIYMSDFLNYDRIWSDVWEPMYEVIKYEYPNHRKLFNEWWPNYNNEMSSAKEWLKKRTDFFFSHLSDYYNIGSPASLVINAGANGLDSLKLTINDVATSTPVIRGKFFADRSITVKAKNEAGPEVAGWLVTKIGSNGSSYTETVPGDTYTCNMPANLLKLDVVLGDEMSVEHIYATSEQDAIFDIDGTRRASLAKGINIIRRTDGSSVKVVK